MRHSLSALCATFIDCRDTVKNAFFWENSNLYPIAASIFVDKRRRADKERLIMCRDILKENTGVFSNFRSYIKLPMIAMMAVSNDPQGKLKRALDVYAALKEHFFTSDYLPLAAMSIAEMAEPAQYEELARRTRRIYDLMKDEHPFLTSSEDSVFAALLALSDKPDEELVRDAEQCYNILKPNFFSGDAVQSLSHVLALCDGDAEVKCSRAMAIFKALKETGNKYGTGYELATLGVLAMLPGEVDDIAEDVATMASLLKGRKGYGIFGAAKAQRLMHAAMIVVSEYLGDANAMQAAAVTSTISIIIAQQAAVCASVAASAAAASSAAASSGS